VSVVPGTSAAGVSSQLMLFAHSLPCRSTTSQIHDVALRCALLQADRANQPVIHVLDAEGRPLDSCSLRVHPWMLCTASRKWAEFHRSWGEQRLAMTLAHGAELDTVRQLLDMLYTGE